MTDPMQTAVEVLARALWLAEEGHAVSYPADAMPITETGRKAQAALLDRIQSQEVQRIKDAKNPLFAKAQLYSKLIEMKELLDKLDQSPSEVIRGTTSDDPAFNDLQ